MNEERTLIWSVEEAVRNLRMGAVVAFPSPSSFGLAVAISNPRAIQALTLLKERATSHPYPVLVSDADMARRYCESLPKWVCYLLDRADAPVLTLIVRASADLDPHLTRDGTIAVRRANHPTETAVVQTLGAPVTATSANLSGESPLMTTTDVVDWLTMHHEELC